jgi:hypothetical protein
VTPLSNAQSAALRGSGIRFIFIESICTDLDILNQNYINKMMYSPDYQGMPTEKVSRWWPAGGVAWQRVARAVEQHSPELRAMACRRGGVMCSCTHHTPPTTTTRQAVSDFVDRIRKYEEVYEPITDRAMHYIKLTDMCVCVCVCVCVWVCVWVWGGGGDPGGGGGGGGDPGGGVRRARTG